MALKLQSLGVGKAPKIEAQLAAFIDAQDSSLVATAKQLVKLDAEIPVAFQSSGQSVLVKTRLKKVTGVDAGARSRFITAEVRVADNIKTVMGQLLAALKTVTNANGDTQPLALVLTAIARRPSETFFQHGAVKELLAQAISLLGKLKPRDYYQDQSESPLRAIEGALERARDAADQRRNFSWRGIDPTTLKTSKPYSASRGTAKSVAAITGAAPEAITFSGITVLEKSEQAKKVRLSGPGLEVTCDWQHVDGTWELGSRVTVAAKGQAPREVQLTPALEAMVLGAHLSLGTPARAVWALTLNGGKDAPKIVKIELEEGGYAYVRPQSSPFNARAADAEHGYTLLAEALGYFFAAPVAALTDQGGERVSVAAEVVGFRTIDSLRREKSDFPAGSGPILAVIDLLDFITNNDDRNLTNIGVDRRGRVRGIDTERAFVADDKYSLLWARHYDYWAKGQKLPPIQAAPEMLDRLQAMTLEDLTEILRPANLDADQIHRCFERIQFVLTQVAAHGPLLDREPLDKFRTKGVGA